MTADPFEELRRQMIAVIAAETVFLTGELGKASLDRRVLEIMGRVPRHEFVPVELRAYAYANTPLPIGFEKTISQPFIVALMTDLLALRPDDRVLEIGTGLGYQAAILSPLARTVYSVEIIEELAAQAKKRLAAQGCANVELRLGNGFHGWPEHAPFDKIIVTAGTDLVPPPLLYQLKPGGRMVIPTGLPDSQQLVLVEKDAEGRIKAKEFLRVRFSLLEGTE
ncbi:MAG TPA: protein-L-isoaspartate(D-aspartate) O-methyltransferase [Burkholderiales bacterium]|nr:protein-L-isoaspartate(D-aspartate) O-methyltransferase [Burkholderiales bacterium]